MSYDSHFCNIAHVSVFTSIVSCEINVTVDTPVSSCKKQLSYEGKTFNSRLTPRIPDYPVVSVACACSVSNQENSVISSSAAVVLLVNSTIVVIKTSVCTKQNRDRSDVGDNVPGGIILKLQLLSCQNLQSLQS